MVAYEEMLERQWREEQARNGNKMVVRVTLSVAPWIESVEALPPDAIPAGVRELLKPLPPGTDMETVRNWVEIPTAEGYAVRLWAASLPGWREWLDEEPLFFGWPDPDSGLVHEVTTRDWERLEDELGASVGYFDRSVRS